MKKSGAIATLGCSIPLVILLLNYLLAYLPVGYSLDYWVSQAKGCPYTVPVPAKILVTLVTPGYIFPAAAVTYVTDTVRSEDVLPGPRAKRQGQPTCN